MHFTTGYVNSAGAIACKCPAQVPRGVINLDLVYIFDNIEISPVPVLKGVSLSSSPDRSPVYPDCGHHCGSDYLCRTQEEGCRVGFHLLGCLVTSSLLSKLAFRLHTTTRSRR